MPWAVAAAAIGAGASIYSANKSASTAKKLAASNAANAGGGDNALSANAPLPQFNANMSVPQNMWTHDGAGNMQFNVPGYLGMQAQMPMQQQVAAPAAPQALLPPGANPVTLGGKNNPHAWMQQNGQTRSSLAELIGSPAFQTWYQNRGTQK